MRERNDATPAEISKRKGSEPQKATARPTYADVAANTPSSAAVITTPPTPANREGNQSGHQWPLKRRRSGKKGLQKVPLPPENPHNPKKKKKKRKVKFRSPTTAAVSLTLAAGAAERGVRYVNLLTQAKAAIDLGELGIPRLGFRLAETGACVLTIDGVRIPHAPVLSPTWPEVLRRFPPLQKKKVLVILLNYLHFESMG
ncbi:Gag protein [Danaus plexippus plexippus]|uniref:Gag protein n=1 Tax=Danaus plexippus plexippus TaxID=278856 RepID=A0A212EL83_DANPL|nr:Gag protein [Danaus plexippus plexippus]